MWKENKLTPWLGPARMNWFKDNYLPNKDDWTKWDASPIFAPDELLKQTPAAWIAVAEMDILRDEGIAYGNKLKELGIPVETVVYKGAPHPIMAMDGYVFYSYRTVWSCADMLSSRLKIGAQMVTDATTAMRKIWEET